MANTQVTVLHVPLPVVTFALLVGMIAQTVPVDLLPVVHERDMTAVNWILAVVNAVTIIMLVSQMVSRIRVRPWVYFSAMIISWFSLVDYVFVVVDFWHTWVLCFAAAGMTILAGACWRVTARSIGRDFGFFK